MTDQAKPRSRAWLRFLRLSLRGMIVVVLIVGGWLGWFIRGVRIERDAVAAIERSGGSVNYDWEWKKGDPIPDPTKRSWVREWLADRVMHAYFGHVIKVRQIAFGNVDVELAHIGRLGQLEELTLGGFAVTDAGLRHLKGLSKLRNLDLSGSEISNDGLENLKDLTSLRVLDLSHTWVTTAGLVQLRGLTNLERLDLSSCDLSDAGLVHLRGLLNLRMLGLEETKVTYAGVRELKRVLPNTIIRRSADP